MQTFLHSALPKIFSEKPSSSRRAKKPSKNKKSKKKYLSRRKHRRKSTSTRSKRRNDYSSENKSIRKYRKISFSHDNAISTHSISHDQQLEDQKREPKNPQEITQINQQLNEQENNSNPNEYQQENYSNPTKYINKNPRRNIPFQANHQYQQIHHNYQYQQQNDSRKFCFTRNIIPTFGTIQKVPNSNTPILTISQIKLYKIALQLTPSELNRNQHYHNNSGHAQHNYINPNSQHMYRCPSGICQYQILNPQNIRTSILQHCENFHKNNILTYKYTDDTTNDWVYVHYLPNN